MTGLRPALAMIAGAAVVAVGLPAVAQASELPVVQRAHSDYDGDYGTLLVTVSAPHGVESLHAELTTFATGEEVASTDDFALRSGTEQDGVWASAQPFLLDELGNYRVHVEVTDTEGNQVRRDNAGTLHYTVTTYFEQVTLDRTTVTYEEREVAVSGVLMGRWPGTGDTQPLGGFPVSVNAFWDWDNVTTQPDGSFTGSVTITEANEQVWAQYHHQNDYPFYRNSQPEYRDIAIDPRPTRLKLKVSPHRVDRGESVTVRGRLFWKTGDGWEPVGGEQLGLLFCHAYCSTTVGYPVTDAEGWFELPAEPFQTGYFQAGYRATGEWGMPDPFVAEADATADVAVLQPASFLDFTAERDGDGMVGGEGHLQFGNFTPGEIPVEVQYSPNGIAGWQTVTTVNAGWDGSGEGFSFALEWPHSGHWRAFYPGQPDWFQSAVSTPVHVP